MPGATGPPVGLGPPPARPRPPDLPRPARPPRDHPGRRRRDGGARRPTRSPAGVRTEFVVTVAGAVARAPARHGEPRAGDRRRSSSGRPRVEILSEAKTPPFYINEPDAPIDEALRLSYRYLDLRREPMQQRLLLRSRLVQAIREVHHANGFVEIETPNLIKSTPEGARDFIVPVAPPAGHRLRPAAEPAAAQAAAHGRRHRPLLPDRPLLPRRGPARRPPAGVHPARPRDELRRPRRR